MITELSSNSQRHWLRSIVYRVYAFRFIMKELKEAQDRKDKQKTKTLEEDRLKAYKKINSGVNKGLSIGLSETQITEINKKIVELISERKKPKEIIQILREEKLQ
ncbi:MAG: hypothetical protein ABIE22_03235 [archaeon]